MTLSKNPPMKGKFHTDDTRRKLRISHIDRMEKLGICPRFNKNGCDYLDRLSEETGWDIQHALNGGEYYIKDLGYFVDGFDSQRNIVVEYDEPGSNHFRCGKLNDRGMKRMREIIDFLGCRFFRYNEKQQILKEYK